MKTKTEVTTMLANRNYPNATGWQDRHDLAVMEPNNHEEYGIVNMLRGWAAYASNHQYTYGSLIGDDGVLGPEWEAIGDSLRGLLNGNLGRLDGGTLDGFILNKMRENGINTENK